MNKKLMAVAVAGAFAAPAVVQAQSSTVQLYGNLTYEYGYVTDMGDSSSLGQDRSKTDVAQTPGGSGIGIRGQEKLGGGLTAWFQCESSADVRGVNNDGFCSRNSAVGFKGAWGNLHFGRWDTPFKRTMVGNPGMKGTGLLGSAYVFSGHSTSSAAAFGDEDRNVWARRESALTYYESPVFSGFQILAAFSPGNAATNATLAESDSKPRVLSIGGVYKNGPLAIGLGYERHNQLTSPQSSSTISVSPTGTNSTSTSVTPNGGDDHAWTVSAAYTFMNKIKVGAQYLKTNYELGLAGDSDKASWLVSADWKIAGPHSVQAGYTQAGNTNGSNYTVTIGGGQGVVQPNNLLGDTGGKFYSISYQYTFSKRTNVRLGYAVVDNDDFAKYALGGLSQQTLGQKQKAIVLFMQHRF